MYQHLSSLQCAQQYGRVALCNKSLQRSEISYESGAPHQQKLT